MKKLTVDLHCHSQMKAYGHSFDIDDNTFENSWNLSHKNSAWWRDWPTEEDIERNMNGIGLTTFTQSDFRTCADGEVAVVFSSLYPLEKAFVKPLNSEGDLVDKLLDCVTEFGKPRIDFVQKMKGMDYFKDLEFENRFNLIHNGKIKEIAGQKFRYRYVKNYDELQQFIATSPSEIQEIYVINSIEGGHALGCGIAPFKAKTNINKILKNVEKLKKDWEYPPMFITLAHHFYNELSGHAKSITGIPNLLLNQKKGMDEGITDEGWKVVKLLLDENKGARIYIDVKHMSLKARKEYYDYVKSRNYDIPIIASHGAVTGFHDKSSSGVNVRSDIREAHKDFNSADINFFDFELLQIDNSEGIIGIQLDERRIASKSALRKLKTVVRNDVRKISFHAAGLIWRQIRHMAEVLDRNDRFAWGIQSLGSDFDGIVNPIDGYFTSAHFKFLDHFLLMHAHNYVQNDIDSRMRNEFNKDIHEEEIVNRFMSENAMRFLERWF